MGHSVTASTPGQSYNHLLLAYMADLELEIDRLRKHSQYVHHQVRESLKRIQLVCTDSNESGTAPPALAQIAQTVTQLAAILQDLQELPGYHPAHDQVIAIAVRPLVEQVFRWQQRLENAPRATLRLEMESEHVEWFPARLRHILDNLISNALKYRDPSKEDSWVHLGLRVWADGYEFTISDNGMGMPARDRSEISGLLYRAAPARAAGLGVGLAVVKWLIEQSGGTLTVDSGEGMGTIVVVVLPRYEVDDFLT
jgi:signal transduction histidine kinase